MDGLGGRRGRRQDPKQVVAGEPENINPGHEEIALDQITDELSRTLDIVEHPVAGKVVGQLGGQPD